MVEGSDDEFSDLELEDDMEMNINNPSTPAAAHIHTSPSSTLRLLLPEALQPLPPLQPQLVMTPYPVHQVQTLVIIIKRLIFCHSVEPPTTWSEELKPVTIRDFTSQVGPAVDIPESPIEMFELFY